jgi:hypothetical protein
MVLLFPPGASGKVLFFPPGAVGMVLLFPPGASSAVLLLTPGASSVVLLLTPGASSAVLLLTPGVSSTVLLLTPGTSSEVFLVSFGESNGVILAFFNQGASRRLYFAIFLTLEHASESDVIFFFSLTLPVDDRMLFTTAYSLARPVCQVSSMLMFDSCLTLAVWGGGGGGGGELTLAIKTTPLFRANFPFRIY